MTEKQFKVHAEEYQDTDDMGYAIAPPVTYYHVGNSEIGFNFDTESCCRSWEYGETKYLNLKEYEHLKR